MTHHNMILALIQDFSVGHIIVTNPLEISHRLNEYVSNMMQCLVASKMCRLRKEGEEKKITTKIFFLYFKNKEKVLIHQ